MVATLDDLRPSHLRLLAHVTRNLAKPSSTGMERRGVYVEVWDGADPDIVRRDWRDLVDHGVLEPFQEKHRGTPFAMFDRTERAGTPINQVGDVTYLQATISSFGQRFATFIGVDGVVGLEHDDGQGGVRRE